AALRAAGRRESTATGTTVTRRGGLLVIVLLLALAAPPAVASAAPDPEPVPALRIDVASNATAAPGATHDFLIQIANTGTAAADGTSDPIVVSGTLPAGLRALGAVIPSVALGNWDCTGIVPGAQTFACTYTRVLAARAGFAVFTL